MQIGFIAVMFILGACMGSFLCCQARRLHLRESSKSKSKKLGSRSVCLHCHKQLKWYDNLPIISWLVLKGKCRHCHKKIGLAELLSELGLGLSFLLISTTINILNAAPLEWVILLVALLLTLSLGFLAIYDGLYGELPTFLLILSIIIAILLLVLKEWAILSSSQFSAKLVINPLLAVLILGGLYLVLYLISKGKWVGDGDWLLATSIAIALASPWLALIALFLANLLASFIMYPILKKDRTLKIHLGPFLVIAFVITYSFSDLLISLVGF